MMTGTEIAFLQYTHQRKKYYNFMFLPKGLSRI